MPDLLLASASPRRAALLRGAGIDLEVRPTATDESARPHEPAVAYARRIAEAKLTTARDTIPNPGDRALLLAADTVVWLEDDAKPLGKPTDMEDAARMLGRLLGTHHFVTTAWALRTPTETLLRHETTRVAMRSPPPSVIRAYLATDEWTDKAGAYGIQGTAGGWVTHIAGSYTNVVGLPLAQVLAAIEQATP